MKILIPINYGEIKKIKKAYDCKKNILSPFVYMNYEDAAIITYKTIKERHKEDITIIDPTGISVYIYERFFVKKYIFIFNKIKVHVFEQSEDKKFSKLNKLVKNNVFHEIKKDEYYYKTYDFTRKIQELMAMLTIQNLG